MSGPVLDIGMAYCGDFTGLQMTLSGLRRQIFLEGLDDLVTVTVVGNLHDHTVPDVRKFVEQCDARFIHMPEPIGTGPPRDRLFREPGAPWQAVIDDHVEFMPGDVAWLAKFATLNPSDDLYHGVMLASLVGRRGVPTIRWTHWTLQWGDDGLFGRHQVNPAAADPECPPFRIPHSGLGFFMARRASWLGLPPEQRGFGCEGYLPLAYMQAGRAVWCLPHARLTHCFIPASIKPKRPNRWTDRAANYLGFWQRLAKNPFLTFAGIKQTHCRPDRLSPQHWEKIITKMGIDEAAALASDPPMPEPMKPSVRPKDPTAWQDCQHRGEVVSERKADLCGVPKGNYPVYACTLHGECVQTRFCKKQSERTCFTCDDAVAAPKPADVAVVIPCHNYGHYLGEAIESCLQQTARPAEIIVIDDASTDDTADVAARYVDRGVRYKRVEERSAYQARRHGMDETTAPFLVFLDADDVLGPEYIARGRPLFTNPLLGLAWTDLQEFGDSTRVRSYPKGDIERKNYIHAGAMVRRVALEQSSAFEQPRGPRNITSDWFAWREVIRAGWQDQRFDGEYRYRQHGRGVHLATEGVTYYEEAHLDLETVPIILPLSGRDQWWEQLTNWVARQTWPAMELLVIDTSGREDFRRQVKQWLAAQDCATTYIPLVGTNGLADADRTKRTHYRAVQRMMPTIYRHLDRTRREFNLIVEDDVLPPVDAIERLMKAMTSKAACVSGVVRSRYQPGIIAWDDARLKSIPEPRSGVQKIHGTGFGCLLYRRSVFSQQIIHHGGNGNFDHELSLAIGPTGREWLINWDVHCVHAGIPAEGAVSHAIH